MGGWEGGTGRGRELYLCVCTCVYVYVCVCVAFSFFLSFDPFFSPSFVRSSFLVCLSTCLSVGFAFVLVSMNEWAPACV